MGNTLHSGDGLSVADMSAIDSYSVGMTSYHSKISRTTTDDHTASVMTRQQLTATDSHRSRYSRRGRPHHHHQPRSPPSHQRQYNQRDSRHTSSPRSSSRPQYAPRETTDASRTDKSTAYHRGYQYHDVHDEARDDGGEHRDYRSNQERSRYDHDDRHQVSSSSSPRDRDYINNGMRSSSRRSHQSPRDHDHHHHQQPLKPKQPLYKRSESLAVSTIADIAPAETDMAYNGSQDEYEVKLHDDTVIPTLRYPNDEEPTTNVNDAVDDDEKEDEVPSTASTVLDSLARLENEQQRIQEQVMQSNNESLQSASFSTLTKTVMTLDTAEQREFNHHHHHHRHHDGAGTGSKDKPIHVVEDNSSDNDDMNNPAQKKLEELLKKQQVQEEKLQEQLEQLRVQKEQLQQLQEEKKRESHHQPITTITNEVRHKNLGGGDEAELATRKETTKVGESKTNGNESAKKLHDEQAIIDRLDRARQMTAGKRNGQPPESAENEDEDEPQVLSVEEDFASIEDNYLGKKEDILVVEDEDSSTGSATGELDGLAPELEDVPSPCKINLTVPGAHQENDMTTLPASLTEGGLDMSSTLHSKNEGQEQEEEDEDEEFAALSEALSSMGDDIDLEFVAKYDKAFNAFLDSYPSLFDKTSDLIQNLKVAKLQRILEVSYQTECDLEAHLDNTSEVKTNLEGTFQLKLKDASRLKAARSIELQSDLNHWKKQSKSMEGKLTMDIIAAAAKRATKFHGIKAELKRKDVTSREGLIAVLLDTELEVKNAIEASPTEASSDSEQKIALQQCQIDNAILKAEAKVLERKVSSLRKAAEKQAWVDAVLLRMDKKKVKKLKTRFEKKLGVSF